MSDIDELRSTVAHLIAKGNDHDVFIIQIQQDLAELTAAVRRTEERIVLLEKNWE